MKANKNLNRLVQEMDAAKKVNPRDLSSDQNLTIGIMNLVAIENKLADVSGDMENIYSVVREMRNELMVRVTDDWVACDYLVHLLGRSAELIDMANRAMGNGNMSDAYALYDQAYEMYVLFWGLNMGLVDIADIRNEK